jgi:hypothetical protein
MTKSQKASAVRRKRAAGNPGGKPTNVATFAKRKKNEYGKYSMRKRDNMPARNKKNFSPTKKGAGMTRAGVAAYRRKNPGSKIKNSCDW